MSAYRTWTNDRLVVSLGTNDGSPPLAFQHWHHFKEAFAPELIHRAASQSSINVAACLDPFGGSGTTALTCQMLGIASTTVEVNPFLADVIETKLEHHSAERLIDLLQGIRRSARRSGKAMIPELPPTFVEPGVKGRWLYNRGVATRVFSILDAIERSCVNDPSSRRFFRIILGGMLIEVSNVIISGKGRRYRQNWTERVTRPDAVDELFAAKCESAIRDIIHFNGRPEVAYEVVRGDARQQAYSKKFDLAVFSPPYPNSFDYTDVYNIQLWMLGYLRGTQENMSLRRSTLSSHVQVTRPFNSPPDGSSTLDETLKILTANREQLWSRHLPEMVGGYFADLLSVTRSVLSSLNPGAACWIVVGDSTYKHIHIPVAHIMSELVAASVDCEISIEPIRHMKTSAQQGFNAVLAESLIQIRT